MAKAFSALKTLRFDVNFAVTNLASGGTLTLGGLPKNILVTDGWAYVSTSITDTSTNTTTLSIGYTDAAAGFYPATAVSALTGGVYLKLLPGVINVVAAQPLTTVDTPAEAVALGRNSGDTFGNIVLQTIQDVKLTASADHKINAGKVTIWLEYLTF